jgi:hypothetical protein
MAVLTNGIAVRSRIQNTISPAGTRSRYLNILENVILSMMMISIVSQPSAKS